MSEIENMMEMIRKKKEANILQAEEIFILGFAYAKLESKGIDLKEVLHF
jgi:hypothetical protein